MTHFMEAMMTTIYNQPITYLTIDGDNTIQIKKRSVNDVSKQEKKLIDQFINQYHDGLEITEKTTLIEALLSKLEEVSPGFTYIHNKELILDFVATHEPLPTLAHYLKNANDEGDLSWYFYYALDANNYQKTYDALKQKPDVKALGECRVGFKNYEYDLTNEFKLIIDTNFNYGRTSYFMITLIFMGIPIVPYERMMIYKEDGKGYLNYTRAFDVDKYCFEKAFTYVKTVMEAYYNGSKGRFIKEYVEASLETMTYYLNQMIQRTQFFYFKDLSRLNRFLNLPNKNIIYDYESLASRQNLKIIKKTLLNDLIREVSEHRLTQLPTKYEPLMQRDQHQSAQASYAHALLDYLLNLSLDQETITSIMNWIVPEFEVIIKTYKDFELHEFRLKKLYAARKILRQASALSENHVYQKTLKNIRKLTKKIQEVVTEFINEKTKEHQMLENQAKANLETLNLLSRTLQEDPTSINHHALEAMHAFFLKLSQSDMVLKQKNLLCIDTAHSLLRDFDEAVRPSFLSAPIGTHEFWVSDFNLESKEVKNLVKTVNPNLIAPSLKVLALWHQIHQLFLTTRLQEREHNVKTFMQTQYRAIHRTHKEIDFHQNRTEFPDLGYALYKQLLDDVFRSDQTLSEEYVKAKENHASLKKEVKEIESSKSQLSHSIVELSRWLEVVKKIALS